MQFGRSCLYLVYTYIFSYILEPVMPLALLLASLLNAIFCRYSFPQTDITIEYIGSLINTQGIQFGMAFDKQLGIHPVIFLHIWYHFVAN